MTERREELTCSPGQKIMSKEMRSKLTELINTYGVEIVLHSDKLLEEIEKTKKTDTREYFLFLTMINEGYARKLITSLEPNIDKVVNEIKQDLTANKELTEEEANLVVDTWKEALGYDKETHFPSYDYQLNEYLSKGEFLDFGSSLSKIKIKPELTTVQGKLLAYHGLLEISLTPKGELGDSKNLFAEAEKLNPPAVLLCRGMAACFKNKYKDALLHLEKTLTSKLDRVQAAYVYYYQGISLYNLNKLQESITSLKTSLSFGPDEATIIDIYIHLADNFYFLRQHGDAIYYGEQIINIDPTCGTGYMVIGESLLLLEKPREALTYFDKALETDLYEMVKGRIYREKARILHREGELEEALDTVQKAISKNSHDLTTHRTKGLILEDMNYPDQAIKSYETALELCLEDQDKVRGEIYRCMAYCYNKLNDASRTIDYADKAIALNPDDYPSYVIKGDVCMKIDSDRGALDNYEKALSFVPNNPPAHYNLGLAVKNILVKGKKVDEDLIIRALESFDIAIENDFLKDWAHAYKGIICMYLNDYQKMLEENEKAIAVNPNNALAHNNKGYSLEMLGKRKGAIKSFEKAFELDPNNEYNVREIAEKSIRNIK